MKTWKGISRVFQLLFLIVIPLSLFSQTNDASRIFSQNSGGVFALVAYGENKETIANGTAFALDETIVVTNYHLISRAFDAEAVTAKGKRLKIEGIVAVSKPFDVVFLKIKGKVQPLAIGNSDDLAQKARVFAVGSNEQNQLMIFEGTIRRFLELSPVNRFIEVSLSMSDSFSGGPLFDINGFVTGLIVTIQQKGVRCIIPLNLFMGVTRSGFVTSLRDITHEDYFSSLEGVYLAGRLAALAGDLATAKTYLEKTVRLNPTISDAYVVLGSVCINQREFAAASSAYARAIELDDKRVEAYHGLGTAYNGLKRYQEAIPILEKAVSLDPSRREAFYELGAANEEVKDFAKAVEAFEKYLALKPENAWNGYLRLGLCRKEIGQYEAAVDALQQAQKLLPRDIKTNFEYAETLVLAKQYDKAEEVFRSLCAINPEGATTYLGKIIQMYDEAGQYDKAIEGARKVVEINPKNELAVYNLGIMYLKLGMLDDAVRTFKECLALKPDYIQAYYNLGYAYAKQNKYKESIEAFKYFVGLVPDNPDGWLNIGVGFMMLKDFESALEPLRKCIELRPDRADAHYNLAIIYLNLKDNYSAREIYKVLVNLKRQDLADKLRKLLR